KNREFEIDSKSSFLFREGMFDELFKRYSLVADRLRTNVAGKILDREIRYIINHKDAFRFKELENINYDYVMRMKSHILNKKLNIDIDEFSIFSKDSGIRIQHSMERDLKLQYDWSAK